MLMPITPPWLGFCVSKLLTEEYVTPSVLVLLDGYNRWCHRPVYSQKVQG